MKKVNWFNVNYPWKTRTKRSRTKYFIVIEIFFKLIFLLGARLNDGSLLVQLTNLILLRNTKSSVELFPCVLDESLDDGELNVFAAFNIQRVLYFHKQYYLTFCQTLSVNPGTSRGNQKPLGNFLMEIWTTGILNLN